MSDISSVTLKLDIKQGMQNLVLNKFRACFLIKVRINFLMLVIERCSNISSQ